MRVNLQVVALPAPQAAIRAALQCDEPRRRVGCGPPARPRPPACLSFVRPPRYHARLCRCVGIWRTKKGVLKSEFDSPGTSPRSVNVIDWETSWLPHQVYSLLSKVQAFFFCRERKGRAKCLCVPACCASSFHAPTTAFEQL